MQKDDNGQVRRQSTAFFTEDLLSKTGGSIYYLVHLSILRSLELADGKPALVNSQATDKVVTIAFKEIAQGKIALKGKKQRIS